MKLQTIGYFSKPHGLKGHLVLFTDLDFDVDISVVFIENKGSQAPYFIEEMTEFNKGFLVKLEGINDVNAAAVLKNKEVLADEKFIIEEDEFEFLNFVLIDKSKGEVGVITGIEGSETNPLIVVNVNGKEILLPFAEDLITKIVKTKKQVFYNAPEGLIDMYLEN